MRMCGVEMPVTDVEEAVGNGGRGGQERGWGQPPR